MSLPSVYANKIDKVFNNNDVYTSKNRGVKPLLDLVECDDLQKYVKGEAVDKVVGKAAAFLYVILQISRLHVGVISKKALHVLKINNIDVTYDNLVPYIINRNKDGKCPLETALLDVEDSIEALDVIKSTLLTLRNNKK